MTSEAIVADEATPYAQLSPDTILDAVDSVGLRSSAHLLALGSYENRVYQIGIEDAAPVVVKFYRPGRWSDAAIREEHAFTQELADAEIPVATPMLFGGESLHSHAGYRFAIYERKGGHAPALDDLDCLAQLGRTLGRVHAIGRRCRFEARDTLDVESFGDRARTAVLRFARDAGHDLSLDLRDDYATLSELLLERLRPLFAAVPFEPLRLHGDLHVGNVLWRGEVVYLVDFDDARMGPAIQDLYLLLSGPRGMRERQLLEIVDAYNDFHDFRAAELALVEPLRTLRLLHHAAWLAERWHDPAFPRAFPWFGDERYWREHIAQLREQLALLDEPPLRLHP